MVEGRTERYEGGASRSAGFDVVLGNPPYLNQLESATALNRRAAMLLRLRSDGVVGGLADMASAFMSLQSAHVSDGGAMALVVPQSFLVASDSGPVRKQLATNLRLTGLWVSNEHVFADAAVFTCACTFRRLDHQRAGNLRRWTGAMGTPASTIQIDTANLADRESWSPLFADTLGIPQVNLGASGTLGDWATTTADFRDQYYGLEGFLVDMAEADDSEYPPVVTTGLIDLGETMWGRQATRILKQRWQNPRIDAARMRSEGTLGDWIASRSQPKVLVATQTKVLEVFCDVAGRYIPSVPLLTVQPRQGIDLWWVGAAIASPVVCAWAAAQYAGAALAVGALKLSATQVAGLPLPSERGQEWERAVRAFQAAHEAREGAARREALVAFGSGAAACYGLGDEQQRAVVQWWVERLGEAGGEE